MNEKYFCEKLNWFRRLNRSAEIIIAIGSSTSVAGWKFWNTGMGSYVWPFVAAVTTLIAVLKPILQLSKKIEKYSKLQVGYNGLYLDLKELVQEVARDQAFTKESQRKEKHASDRYKSLALLVDFKPSKRLLKRCMNEVNREVPPGSLWMP